MANHLPEQLEKLTTEEGAEGGDADEKKRQKRGGKGMMKAKKERSRRREENRSLNCSQGKKESGNCGSGNEDFWDRLKSGKQIFLLQVCLFVISNW